MNSPADQTSSSSADSTSAAPDATQSFVEPGSGMTMTLGKFYLLSDSGGIYHPEGFDTAEAAVEFTKSKEFEDTYGVQEEGWVGIPKFVSPEEGWPEDMYGVNAFKADDLKAFHEKQDELRHAWESGRPG